MIEFRGICGRKIAFNPASIDYIQNARMAEKVCTLLCFRSGKKLFVLERYDDAKRMIEDAMRDGESST